METLWVILGIVVLGLTLVDVFLTALNYDEAGFFAGRLAALQWTVLRSITRRLSRRWRPVALRQVTGLQIMITVVAWVAGVILGYALIYLGNMQGKNFQFDGVHAGFFSAIYFSAAQFSTAGTSQVTPNTDLLRVLSIAETITSLVLVSLILTFLLGIYQVISDLRTLSSTFFSAERGAGDPLASLVPFFPGGEARGLDGHLQGISDSFGSYSDGLRLHHAAYYFQSGRDHFSLPYSVRMMGGVIGGLRWGLPTGHPSSMEPMLIPLAFQFEQFGNYLQKQLRWKSLDVPETVDYATFCAVADSVNGTAGRSGKHSAIAHDQWVEQFLRVNRDMATLTATKPSPDLKDAYSRYTGWLPFAYRAQQITTAVSRDLDYQPIGVEGNPVTQGDERAAIGLAYGESVPVPVRKKKASAWRSFLRRRVGLIDPGYSRLVAAARAVLAAVVAVVSLYALFTWMGVAPMPAAIFGGIIAMSMGATAGNSKTRRPQLTGLLAVLPVLMAIGVAVLVPHEALWEAIALVVLAFLGVWLGRFGRALSGLGQLLFISYYFTLLLRLELADASQFAVAAVVGVLWSFLLQFITLPGRPGRVLRAGVKAFEQRLVIVLDPLIDTVSWARWDPDLRKRVKVDMRQLHRSASFLNGQLVGGSPELDLDDAQAASLRLKVFDAELAAINVAAAARLVTGASVSVVLRARLAGQLERLQEHIRNYPTAPAWAVPDEGPRSSDVASLAGEKLDREPPADWPEAARRLHSAIFEMLRATDALHQARATAHDDRVQDEAANSSTDGNESPAHAALESGGSAPQTPPTGRRAVQSGLATALALGLGSLVSPTYQYWAALPAYQVLGGTDGETFVKGMQKVIGTILGAAIGFAISIYFGGTPAVILVMLLVCVFASTYYRSVSSPLASFWQMMMFAGLYEMIGKLSAETLELRVLETVIGAGVALLVALLVFPTRTRTKLNRDIAELLHTVDGITASCLAILEGSSSESRKDLTRRELLLNEQVRQVNTTAIPLRRSAGAMDLGGIEGQLTAVWALVYYTRHLVRATERAKADASVINAEDWKRFGEGTSANIAALLGILGGSLPGEVHPSLGLSDVEDADGIPDSVGKVLRELERINQSLLLLIEDLSPDSVTSRRVTADSIVG